MWNQWPDITEQTIYELRYIRPGLPGGVNA